MIGNLGIFFRDGILVLCKFCEILLFRLFIFSEERWLMENYDGFSVDEIFCIKEVFWNRKISKSIVRVGRKFFDVLFFVIFVGERYLDNFVIDVIIWYYF